MKKIDVIIENLGSLFTFEPLTQMAKDWIDEHVQSDAQWFGQKLVVEHRYAFDLAQGMQSDGLSIK